MRLLLSLSLLLVFSACARRGAVTPPPTEPTLLQLRTAAALITPAKVLDRVGVIAHDSMGGRNTPSRGLDLTAKYLADHYQQWGLVPAGENGSYYQTFPVVRSQLDPAATYLELREEGQTTRYTFEKWARFSGGAAGTPVTGPMMIVSGAVDTSHVQAADLAGRIVLFVMDSARPATANNRILNAIRARAPRAILTLQSTSTTSFPTLAANQFNTVAITIGDPDTTAIPVVTMHDSLLIGDRTTTRPDWDALRRSPTPVIIEAPASIQVSLVATRRIVSRHTAPNVVAMIPGSDPVLRNEYVIFSSHMDHVGMVSDGDRGCAPQTRADATVDSICNGADDDASGTIGLMSVAEAFASLTIKPKRSVIILNVSGEEKGLWGSAWFANHPTVPMAQVVANVNLDMIGRNAPDSIVAIGKEHSDMGATLAAVQQRHPELGLIAADDIWPQENFYARSDHFNFARKGVPALFFFNGVHPQYHRPSDEVHLIDGSKLARVAQLSFYFAADLASAPARPVWNPESYDIIVTQQRTPPVRLPASGGQP